MTPPAQTRFAFLPSWFGKVGRQLCGRL